MNTKILGGLGEAHAENYLKKNGYKILERNYRTKIGEIDLIAEKDEMVVFVEVKARVNTKFGQPKEAVNFHKQFKIRKVAEEYLLRTKRLKRKTSFDVVEFIPPDEINHLKNCF